jgi:hypothetical protein
MKDDEVRIVATYLGTYSEVGLNVPDGAIRADGVWYSTERTGSSTIVELTTGKMRLVDLADSINKIRATEGKFPKRFQFTISRNAEFFIC